MTKVTIKVYDLSHGQAKIVSKELLGTHTDGNFVESSLGLGSPLLEEELLK